MASKPTLLSHMLFAVVLLCLSSPIHASPSPPNSKPSPHEFLPDLLSPRQEHSVALSTNQIFIVGGITSNVSKTPDTLNVPSQASPVSLVQSYSIEKQAWTNLSAFPIPVNHGNVAAVDDELYLLGGLLGLNMTLWGGVPNAYKYDAERDEWSAIEDMPAGTERGACAVGVSGEEVFLAGGMLLVPLFYLPFIDIIRNALSRNWP
jgi:hypothetical protein